MTPEKLFAELLGLGLKWRVTECGFHQDRSQVDIQVEHTEEVWKLERCPRCGSEAKGYDRTEPLRWRHLNVMQYRCEIVCRLPRGRCPRRFVPRTTDSAHDQPVAPNRLAQAPVPTGPNQIWVSDLTSVATREGWLYVAVILDLWSRRVVGWSAGPTLQACLVVAALRMALKHRQPPRGLLHHSDRGVQYASGEHRALIVAAGLELSMSRAGNPYDNAVMESFLATYKRECVGLAEEAGGYATRAEAQMDFFGYAETYDNRARRHSALGDKSPVDFETQLN